MSMPEVCDRLDFEIDWDEDEEVDTIGGHVTARLGRLPRRGDSVEVGPYRATVLDVARRRVQRLRLERIEPEAGRRARGVVIDLLRDIGLLDVVDIGVVAALAWVGLRLVRRTRARPALLGLATLGAIYLAARQLGLGLTAAIFQAFFAVLVLVLVVVFQDDLRRIFEQVGAWVSRRRGEEPSGGPGDALVRTVEQLAATRTGALIVVPGREPIDRHVEGGVELDGRISEPLLLSLFDASSPGHDGAVVLENDRVASFAVHLPLSTDREQLTEVGTRHAAALGLSERTDALCIIVSEERGTISIAVGGRLRPIERPRALAIELRKHLRPRRSRSPHAAGSSRASATRCWRSASRRGSGWCRCRARW